MSCSGQQPSTPPTASNSCAFVISSNSISNASAISSCCGIASTPTTFGSGSSANCFQYCNVSLTTSPDGSTDALQNCLATALRNQSGDIYCFSQAAKKSAAESIHVRGANWAAVTMIGVLQRAIKEAPHPGDSGFTLPLRRKISPNNNFPIESGNSMESYHSKIADDKGRTDGGLHFAEQILQLYEDDEDYALALDAIFGSIDFKFHRKYQDPVKHFIKELGIATLDTRHLRFSSSKSSEERLIATHQYSTSHASNDFAGYDVTDFHKCAFAETF
ncbi:hypothetical protein G7Y89_g2255 [Cudoniella acicularis]|uniref:Uncharacterized protein n=1 Tax=Cudoniella acicularis TaxID=354080 RepID=A0A8H4W8T1_9HELO|nr:hypothetical protein G7Y89_g2255 [Cudoniella acicularis]